jgi:O-antigen/teichoic acid export membrane protein
LVATVVYVAAAGLLASALLQSSSATDFVYASAIAVFGSTIIAAQQGALMGLQGFSRMAASQFAQGGLAGLGLIAGAVVDGAVGALAGFSIGTVAAGGISYILVRQEAARAGIRVARGTASVERRRMWVVAMPALAAFVTLYAALLGGQLLLSRSHGGYQQVALFNVAYRWHLGILFIPGTIAPALLPMIAGLRSQGSISGARALFKLNLILAAVITLVPALLMIAAARLVLGFSGAYYSRHPAVLIVLALATVPGAINNVLSAASVGLGAMRAWLVSDLVLAVAFIGTAVAVIPSARAVGLSWAYLAGYVATDGVLVLPLRRRLRS